MRTYRGKGPKVLILVIVCVLLAGFSIGFSALSKSLLIKSHASIKPDSTSFTVHFSSKADELSTDDVVPSVSSDNVTASNAIIDNNALIPTISNFSVELSEVGDKATYVFYAMNTGSSIAYLTNVIYNNVSGESSPKVCTPVSGTTEADAAALCENIKLTVEVGKVTTSATTSVTGHALFAGASDQIIITVEYLDNVTPSATAGDFIVEFGDISLLYSSVEGSGATPGEGDTICVAVDSSQSGSTVLGTEYTCTVNSSLAYNFYVLSTSGDNVNLMMSQNISEDRLFTQTVGGDSETWYLYDIDTNNPTIITELELLTSSWTNITPYNNETYLPFGNSNLAITLNGHARLPKYEEIAAQCSSTGSSESRGGGYPTEDYHSDCNLWVIGNYWTMDVFDGGIGNVAWAFNTTYNYNTLDDYLLGVYGNDKFGIRPVITVSTSDLS